MSGVYVPTAGEIAFDGTQTIALGLPSEIAEDPAVIEAYLGGPTTRSA